MTNKEFEKWMKANPIMFYEGANGATGQMTVKGQTFSVCGAPDQNKRTQKAYIKIQLMNKAREILEAE
ncbi:hypothetical protein EOM81_01680 [bacterium]|nr:hypothetical protein [bacterium]